MDPLLIVYTYLAVQVVINVSALVIEAAIMFAPGHVTAPALLAPLLACEGLSYGAYLATEQAYIADQSTAENRGIAMGLYGMSASLGEATAPVAMGLLAARAWLPVVGLFAVALAGV